jgi:peptidoglycan/LPS O-acetylase OafA/YrhL
MDARKVNFKPSSSTSASFERAVDRPRSFVTLDALRGIAALPVVYLHTAHAYGPFMLFPHAHLAVDFFLLLSGFVMTYVYQQRLDAGWRTRDFLHLRLLRLYPLYFLGLIAGAIFLALRDQYGKVHTQISILIELLALGLFFLPTPPLPLLPSAPQSMYPYDVPAWSLFFELVANFFHALVLRRRSLRLLLGFCLVMAAVQFEEAIQHHGFDYGADRKDYLLGLGRTFLSYPLGAILYRLWQTGRGRLQAPPWLIGLALATLLAAPRSATLNGAFEWLVVILAFPLLLWLGACSKPTLRFVRPARWLGALSYPLYILHVPFFAIFEQLWVHVSHQSVDFAAPWVGLVFLMFIFPLAFWIGELYDPEARKLLKVCLPIPKRDPN